jgi:hypothetical protein
MGPVREWRRDEPRPGPPRAQFFPGHKGLQHNQYTAAQTPILTCRTEAFGQISGTRQYSERQTQMRYGSFCEGWQFADGRRVRPHEARVLLQMVSCFGLAEREE